MPPLFIEVFSSEKGEWERKRTIRQKDAPVRIPNNGNPIPTCLFLKCVDNSSSAVYALPMKSSKIPSFDPEKAIDVRTLKANESPLVLDVYAIVRMPRASYPPTLKHTQIRLTHK